MHNQRIMNIVIIITISIQMKYQNVSFCIIAYYYCRCCSGVICQIRSALHKTDQGEMNSSPR